MKWYVINDGCGRTEITDNPKTTIISGPFDDYIQALDAWIDAEDKIDEMENEIR